jgi:hypothetical protein
MSKESVEGEERADYFSTRITFRFTRFFRPSYLTDPGPRAARRSAIFFISIIIYEPGDVA